MPWSSRSCLKIFLPPLAWYVLSLECCNFSVAVQGFDHLWDSKHNYTRRGFHKWSQIINLITLLLLISDSMMRNNTNPRTLGREHIPPWALPMFLLSTVLVCAQSLTLHLTLGPSLPGCVPSNLFHLCAKMFIGADLPLNFGSCSWQPSQPWILYMVQQKVTFAKHGQT